MRAPFRIDIALNLTQISMTIRVVPDSTKDQFSPVNDLRPKAAGS
jgi:hypothetical protein